MFAAHTWALSRTNAISKMQLLAPKMQQHMITISKENYLEAVLEAESEGERDSALLRFRDTRGIRPGGKVRVLERNCDQTLMLVTPKNRVAVGGPAAEKVWVAPAGKVKLRGY